MVGANTSINDDLAADIRLYPNPATEWLQLDVKTYRHRASIALYDAQGKVWLQQDIPQAGVHSISVAHLPAGLYVAHIRDGAAVVSRKITKR